MDPSIVKLLEDDEDETMHSGADVEAFQAALNRDIGGDASNSQLSDSDAGSNNSFSQSLPTWPTSSHDNQTDCQNQEPKISQQQERPSSEVELKQQGPVVEQIQNVASQDASNLPLSHKHSQDECPKGQTVPVSHQNSQTNEIKNSEKDPLFKHEAVKTNNPSCESQYAKLQQMSNQQATANEQPGSQINRGSKQVPFGLLLPILIPQLPKDRAMQLQTLFNKLKLSSQIPTGTSGIITKTPLKKPPIGQKKPLEALGSSPPPPSKKQKGSGASLEQSIEQLNDVTAVSGVDLREEEDQLFSGPKEDSRVSEASRRVVQEEEESLILQKAPLQRKLIEIMTECGLKGMSNDVERCLSLCVEERMRGVISNMIRMSKQRVDIEKTRHRTVVTSDVRQQIMSMNRKAREEWEKKQAEAEKLRKLNDVEGQSGVDGDKEKDEGRNKATKVNKEADDKMRTNAANVAARAAVGGDDMLSKWQLMAEQARQKREGGGGGVDTSSGSQSAKDASRKSSSSSGRSTKDNQERDKKGPTSLVNSGAARKFGRNHASASQTRVARSICVKDVIAVLEREPQMSKSSLLYQMYERIHSDTSIE